MRSAEVVSSSPTCFRDASFRNAFSSFAPLTRAPLMKAITVVLSLGAACAAQAQETPSADSVDTTQTLDSVTVTGSRIRRVDTETANPVTTINREAIEATGKATLGDLIQELPAIAGNATNPNVNNGGGTGASAISLRGLGEKRSRMETTIDHPNLNFSFELIHISDIDPAPLLDSLSPDDAVLAILCRNGNTRQNIRRILMRLAELDRAQIVNAKLERNVLIAVVASGGRYDKYVFRFAKDFSSHDVRMLADVAATDEVAWIVVARVLMNLDEFITRE